MRKKVLIISLFLGFKKEISEVALISSRKRD
jgi:hypothetical protein